MTAITDIAAADLSVFGGQSAEGAQSKVTGSRCRCQTYPGPTRHSPADQGLLRHLNRIHIVETVAETIRPAPALAAMRRLKAVVALGATLACSIPPASLPATALTILHHVPAASSFPRPHSAAREGAGEGPSAAQRRIVTVEHHSHISLTINAAGGTAEFEANLESHARKIAEVVDREIEKRLRRGFC